MVVDDQSEVSDLVSAYHRLRSAEAARQARVRTDTGLGDNELRVLQFLLHEHSAGHAVMPSEIGRYLGVSSASITALLDRLARAGLLERVGHPTDRRSILIAPTSAAASMIAATIDEQENQLIQAARALDEPGRAAVFQFLTSLAIGADADADADAAQVA